MRKTATAVIIVTTLLAGCATPTTGPAATPTEEAAAPTATFVPSPATAPSPTPTEEPSPTQIPPTPTPMPTATPVRQTLGRIFPQGHDSPGVWANVNTGAPDSGDSHFDVCLPDGYVQGQDPVLSPASGRIVEVYWVGEGGSGGQVITIEPDPPLAGVDQMVSSAGLDPADIWMVYFHLGHITAWKTDGWVEAGEPVGTPIDGWWDPDIIAYIIRVGMIPGERQYSPCDLPNTASFCGKCYPGTPYNCP